MIIMAQHPKQQQQQPQQAPAGPPLKTRAQLHQHSAPQQPTQHQQQQAPKASSAPKSYQQLRSNSTETASSAQPATEATFDGRRTLIKNQLYLIEQLQLENANLRNERDHLQLENEELKFQLQMISYSNILSQPAPTPLDSKQLEQLVAANPDARNTNHHLHHHRGYAPGLSTPPEIDGLNQPVIGDPRLSNQVGLPCRKPETRIQPEHDEQVGLYPESDSPSPPHESPQRDITTVNGSLPSVHHSSTKAIANHSLHRVIIEDNDVYPNHNHPRFMNLDSKIDGTSPVDHASYSAGFELFGYANATGLPDKKSQLTTGASRPADRVVETSYTVKAGEPPQSRHLPQDDEERRVKLVEQRYGDSEQVQAAAITIQRAFRKYQICKRFRTITEQLRHTHQSSTGPPTATTTVTAAITRANNLQAEKRRLKDVSPAAAGAAASRPISSGSEKSIDAFFTTSAALASQTQPQPPTQPPSQQREPPSWQSLGCAAERLVAAAASMKQILPTAINGIVKPPLNHQQHPKPQQQQQVFNYPSNEQALEPSVALDHSQHQHQRLAQVKLQSRIGALENNRHVPTKQDSVVEAAISFQQLESMRKRQYRVGLNIFNKHPEKGVSFLVAHAFIDSSAPYVRNSTSYYHSNQLHFIDKQHLVQQQQQPPQQLTTDPSLPKSLQSANQLAINMQTCQLCYEEDNLKRSVAHFLLHRKGLAKEKIGQYLGNLQEPFNQDVLKYYLLELDFYGLEVDVALRKFLSTFRLPGEAQKIEKIVDSFASRYVQNQQQPQTSTNNVPGVTMVQMTSSNHHPVLLEQYQSNPTGSQLLNNSNEFDQKEQQQQQQQNRENYKNNSLHLTKDEIFILTFAIIMLNTDLHSPSLKSTSRMSALQFVNNLRGVFKSRSIDESDLIEIYERVKANQITTTPDHVTHVLKVQQSLTITNFQRKKLPNFCVPHRRLVCFCRLFEIYDVNKKEKPGQHQREIFLFNDLLLVTKLTRRVRANSTQLYTYRQSISLQGLYVQLFQTPHYHHGIRLCQRSNDETIIMFNARNELDRSRFVDDLGESIAEMDEMEIIKAHDIVDTIHFKYLRRLRRHANLHNPTENNHNSQRDQARDQHNEDNHRHRRHHDKEEGLASEPNKSDNLEANGATRLASNTGPSDQPQTGQRGTESCDVGESVRVLKSARSLRSNSKFCSMFNLSNVMLSGGGAKTDAKVGEAAATTRAQGSFGSSSAKAFALTSQQPLKGPPLHARRNHSRGEPGSGSASSSQRRCSTSSVHSLDSGLFLSRDVSPNQSS